MEVLFSIRKVFKNFLLLFVQNWWCSMSLLQTLWHSPFSLWTLVCCWFLQIRINVTLSFHYENVGLIVDLALRIDDLVIRAFQSVCLKSNFGQYSHFPPHCSVMKIIMYVKMEVGGGWIVSSLSVYIYWIQSHPAFPFPKSKRWLPSS